MFLYTVAIIVFFLCIWIETSQTGPHSNVYFKGVPDVKEDTKLDLIERIKFSCTYKDRLNLLSRTYIISFTLSLFIGFAVYGNFPSEHSFLVVLLINTLLLLSFQHYFYFHSDIFPEYSIRKALYLLRKKSVTDTSILSGKKEIKESKDECNHPIITSFFCGYS